MKRLRNMIIAVFICMAAPVQAQSVISINDAIAILDQAVIRDFEMVGYKSPQKVSSIVNKYGYKTKKEYDVYRLTNYHYLYYKNCTIPALMDSGQYPDTPKPARNGVASWVGVDGYSIKIMVFSQSVFNSLKNQFKEAGFEFISTEWDGEHYNNGAFDLVCTSVRQKELFVTISKQY